MLAAALLGVCAPAVAQSSGEQAGRWQFELTPYFWAAGMKGDVHDGALPKTSVDMSFSDIWDNLDFGAMGAFEARKGRWALLFDAIYMKLSTGATSSRTGPGPIGATATATADLKLDQTLLAAAVAYRVSDGPTATDVIGGARYSNIDAEANINVYLGVGIRF